MDSLTQPTATVSSTPVSSPAHAESFSLIWSVVIALAVSLIVVISSVWWMPLVGLRVGSGSVNVAAPEQADVTLLTSQMQNALQNISQLQSRIRWIQSKGTVFAVDPKASYLVVEMPGAYEAGKPFYQKVYIDPDTLIELFAGETQTVNGQSVQVAASHGAAPKGVADIQVGDNVSVQSLYETATSSGATPAMHAVQVLIMR